MGYLRTRPELRARFVAGDRAALTEVFHAYARPLDRVLRRGFTLKSTGLRTPFFESRAERADVTQETFARAFDPETRRAYDATHDYLPFLVGIARNVMASQHRRQDRELPAGGRESWAEGHADIELHDEPQHAYQDERAIAIMREYVASLPEPLRAFHTARHTEGLPQRDVAERLGLTHWKVRALEARLREELLSLVKRAGITGSTSHG